MAPLELRHIASKYRDRFLHIAFIVSGWSLEPEGQRHGCVIAMDGKYLVASGFNGPDRSYMPPTWTWRPGKIEGPKLIHAEANALINLDIVGVNPSRCIMFVTKKPCHACEQLIEASGIQAVMWLQDLSSANSTWVRP